ncbi:MAG: D-lysine 5,6-aminomutase subunit alpha, partial [Clostridiales bacterium]|nr:D-lysine 5,6-aminomutase subunit alpha [Clostridiales bacterium]
EAPLKYMPPTKHSTGNIFQTQAVDTLFNAATVMTGQSIHLLAMMTEAIHTPFLSDRHLAIKNAKMVQAAMRHMADEITFREDGIIQRRAREVLRKADELLGQIARSSLFDALEQGVFADVKRPRDGGKGLDGVLTKHVDYMNPAMDFIREAQR